MGEFIHGETLKKYFKDCFGIDIEINSFTNNSTKETNYVVYKSDADLAVFANKGNDEIICINSNGENIRENKIFAYVKDDFVKSENGSILFKTENLRIKLDGDIMDNDYISSIEEEIYPERTNIKLNAVLQRKAMIGNSMTDFIVDEVIYTNNEEFYRIANGETSKVFDEYNQKKYENVSGARHGVVVINEAGDGLLVDTAGGYDYARYMCFAPRIGTYIKEQLDEEMKQKAVHEMKLYVPLKIGEYNNDIGAEEEIYGNDYYESISKQVKQYCDREGEKGLAEYFWDEDKCRNKVYSIKPDVEIVNDKMMGVAVIKITEPLNAAELDSLKEFVTGQFSDGWGEGFEQHEFKIDGHELYIHFWNSDNYYIHTDEDLKEKFDMEVEQGIAMN